MFKELSQVRVLAFQVVQFDKAAADLLNTLLSFHVPLRL